ncbi:hypothetical protein PG984_006846 [Apiospora sp. TS-2023a]
MGSPVSTAVAVNVSASANLSPAAFTGSTDAVKINTAADETDAIEKIAAGLRMFADKLEAARTGGGSFQLPDDEEKASFRYDKAAVGIPTYSTRGSWDESWSRPFCAYLKFVALWLVFAVVMWLVLPLFFCLVSFHKDCCFSKVQGG